MSKILFLNSVNAFKNILWKESYDGAPILIG